MGEECDSEEEGHCPVEWTEGVSTERDGRRFKGNVWFLEAIPPVIEKIKM